MLRETQHHTLFHSPGGYTKPLTEKEMFNHIKAHPDTTHLAYMYLVQRHLSQQHHYAPGNRTRMQKGDRTEPAVRTARRPMAVAEIGQRSAELVA